MLKRRLVPGAWPRLQRVPAALYRRRAAAFHRSRTRRLDAVLWRGSRQGACAAERAPERVPLRFHAPLRPNGHQNLSACGLGHHTINDHAWLGECEHVLGVVFFLNVLVF